MASTNLAVCRIVNRVATVCALLVAAATISKVAAAPPTAIGRKVENFTLPDVHGKQHSLSDARDRPVVLAIIGVECPLAKKYAPRLRDLATEFAKQGVVFLGIDANVQDSLTEIAAFARATNLTFPLLKDNNNVLANRLGAERTPEVFLLDRQHVIRYHGRIDDQYGFTSASAYERSKPAQRYLADALSELLADKEISRTFVKPEGCLIGRVGKTKPRGDVTYSKQVARILQDRCVSCHRVGEVAPFAMTSYDEVVGWAEMIREVVDQERMPPWFADPRHGHFSNDARLSETEKRQLCAWVENGCPQGDPSDLPAPRKFADGWRMGEPDQVLLMSDEPYTVAAEGLIPYQYFTVDPGWKTDRWIAATETRPGNRQVVHHIRVDVQPKNVTDAFPRGAGIGGYVPGNEPYTWPAGCAIHVPAGAKLVFQIHYTPNGTEQQDRSQIGIRFADPRTVKKIVRGTDVNETRLKIPAGEPDYKVEAQHLFDKDTLLLSLTPHMHARGKSFKFEAEFADGTREVLLDVPHYDFNWQLRYVFAEPRLMPRGARLHCTAHFDNSADNLANPDPTKVVTYGDQTWDEMMVGFYTAIDPHLDVACRALVAASLAAQREAAKDSEQAPAQESQPGKAAAKPTDR